MSNFLYLSLFSVASTILIAIEIVLEETAPKWFYKAWSWITPITITVGVAQVVPEYMERMSIDPAHSIVGYIAFMATFMGTMALVALPAIVVGVGIGTLAKMALKNREEQRRRCGT